MRHGGNCNIETKCISTFYHAPSRLQSREPIFSDMTSSNNAWNEWRDHRRPAYAVNDDTFQKDDDEDDNDLFRIHRLTAATIPHRLRNDLKCVEWDVKPCSIQSNPSFYCSTLASTSSNGSSS